MNGAFESTLWAMVIGDVVALFVVLWLAYSAANKANSRSPTLAVSGRDPV